MSQITLEEYRKMHSSKKAIVCRELSKEGRKLCCTCGNILSIEKFHKTKYILGGRCSSCIECNRKKNFAKLGKPLPRNDWIPQNPLNKICRKCEKEKPQSEFKRDKRSADGTVFWCRDCGWLYARAYHGRDPLPISERVAQNKWDLELVKKAFADRGCQLLENEYKNYETKMHFKCSCGGNGFCSLDRLVSKGAGCPECRLQRYRASKMVSFETIKKMFDDAEYTLLSKGREHGKQKLEYICPNGHLHSITYQCFHSGKRCPTCAIIKHRGSGNGRYRHDLSEEERRLMKRSKTTQGFWKSCVLKLRGYTCEVCGKVGGRFHAHHLNGWSDFPKERYDVNNGVLMCWKEHKQFHKDCGKRHNTREQFYEWLALNKPASDSFCEY